MGEPYRACAPGLIRCCSSRAQNISLARCAKHIPPVHDISRVDHPGALPSICHEERKSASRLSWKQSRICSGERQYSFAVHDPLTVGRETGIQLMDVAAARDHESHC